VPASSFASTTVELECVLPLDEAVDHVGTTPAWRPRAILDDATPNAGLRSSYGRDVCAALSAS
jgi:hypothetical protein